ncbi:potassium/proton antiporter [Sediminibacillus dalangtanensis]|uniref:Potassium/proton antiporter n=1 Tax=Sediminibacillus dalangtanensis TaxID=2729421 RepID=A0ABX7VW45_9BACI|nr:potassium/proton antiporter [Sediminibacillus dalangtanensis]QTN00001.1 potassium/proton antiporter [Sediminibacillus dalangtanensis]
MIQEVVESDKIILLTSLLLLFSILITKLSDRFGLPSLVLFILAGMVVGSDGLGLLYFNNVQIAEAIGVFSLVVILYEGGIQTHWRTIKPVVLPSISLATFGVLITTAIVGLGAKWVFGFSWLEAFLLGSLVGSTDAAAVFAVLKDKNINDKIEATLEGESGTNDPMAFFLTISFIELITTDRSGVLSLVLQFFWQMAGGLLLGLFIGKMASVSLNKIKLSSGGLYPLFGLAFAFFSYSITSLVNASGFLAVYVTALVVGNLDLSFRESIHKFNEGFSWMAQILMFIILGLFVFPSRLFSDWIIFHGILLSGILILIARPIATWISLVPWRYSFKEKTFLSWAGLRGAVPIILALFPMLAEMENSQLFFNAVFFIVLTSALIQGSTIPYAATKLGLINHPKPHDLEQLQVLTLGQKDLDIVQYKVEKQDWVNGKKLKDTNLPKNTLINAVVRCGQVITPDGDTVIQEGDSLYILAGQHLHRAIADELKVGFVRE